MPCLACCRPLSCFRFVTRSWRCRSICGAIRDAWIVAQISCASSHDSGTASRFNGRRQTSMRSRAGCRSQYPNENARKTSISLYPLHTEIVRDYRSVLWTLFAAVGVLLAVGCGNLANLLLLRTAGRQAEFAIRLSLGASRGRLIRHLLGEAVIIAVVSGAAGIGLAAIGLTAWQIWGPANFPRMNETGLNLEIVAFALAVSAVSALACGTVPAWFISDELASALRSSARAMTSERGYGRLRRSFVGLQVAAATVLLVGMGLTVRGFARLERVSPGFSPDQTLSLQLSLPPRTYANREALVRFYEALNDRLSSDSWPRSGRSSLAAPIERPAVDDGYRVSGSTGAAARRGSAGALPRGDAWVLCRRRHHGACGTRVHRPRSRRWSAGRHRQPHAGRSSLAGRTRSREVRQTGAVRCVVPMEIVGVVSDVKHFTLDGPSTADLYVPLRQMPSSQSSFLAARMFWVIRAPGESPRLIPVIREAYSRWIPKWRPPTRGRWGP